MVLTRKRYDVARTLLTLDADANKCGVLSMLFCRFKSCGMILLVCAVTVEERGKGKEERNKKDRKVH